MVRRIDLKPRVILAFFVFCSLLVTEHRVWAQALNDSGAATTIVNPPPEGSGEGTPRIIPANVPDSVRKYLAFPDPGRIRNPLLDRCVTVKSSSCRVHGGACVVAYSDFLCDDDMPEGAQVNIHHTLPGDPDHFNVSQVGLSMREFCESIGGQCVDYQEPRCPWGDIKARATRVRPNLPRSSNL